MTTGVAFFAYNNSKIDYSKLATLAALYVKRHMANNTTCLITDEGTWEWMTDTVKDIRLDDAFDEVVLTDVVHPTNIRSNYDSPWTQFKSEFKNSNKHRVLEYTPFDQTLLLDIDYIVQNNSLDNLFNTDASVALFHDAESLAGLRPGPNEQRLHELGIPMLWSTAVYFDRNNKLTKMFFDLWAHIADNYDYYQFLYGFPGTLYRTDYCVSIAAHIMNGMTDGDIIEAIPGKMINMSQKDDIAKINSIDDWVYLVNNRMENWKDSVTRIKGENVHVMNKRALGRHYPYLTKLFEEAK
jgi:hypothetical protein